MKNKMSFIDYKEGNEEDNKVFKKEHFKYFNSEDIKKNEKGEYFYKGNKLIIRGEPPMIGILKRKEGEGGKNMIFIFDDMVKNVINKKKEEEVG